MTGYPREELEEMVERFMAANREAEKKQDWRDIGQFYTDDAIYGWSAGPELEAMVIGRENITNIVVGSEMEGLDEDAWTFPYQRLLIDEKQAEVVGFYRYLSGKTRPDGTQYEAAGIHGSWFHYAGNFKWDWQRDFLDYGNYMAIFDEMLKNEDVGPRMLERRRRTAENMGKGILPPSYYWRGTAPIQQWDLAPGTKPYTPPPT